LRDGDIVDVMVAGGADTYDLVAAADVFIYVGELDAVFSAVRRVLTPAGTFAFSVEDSAQEPVAIRSSGRFAHSQSYVAGLAAAHGFFILEDRPIPIRKEYNIPIGGRLFVLRRNP
jgi:predicted TPR repeat methyltransferase